MPANVYPKDDRLKLVNPSQYRIWHDSQDIMIPLGKSTTNPLQKEIVTCNTKVYSEIRKGWFNSPLVDFTNCDVYTRFFDRFVLQGWRDADIMQVLYNDNTVHYYDDLGINTIETYIKNKFAVTFDDIGTIQGGFDGELLFFYNDFTKFWTTLPQRSNIVYGTDYSLFFDIVYFTNSYSGTNESHFLFNTGKFLQYGNLPVNCIIYGLKVNAKNTNMDLQIKMNTEVIPSFYSIENFEIVGGGTI